MIKPGFSAHKLETAIRYAVSLLSLWAGYLYYLDRDTVSLASALLCVGLLHLAGPVERLVGFKLPVSWRMVYMGFIIAAMYLGEIHSFFYRFLWWDDFLHTCSAMLITYVALLVFRLLYGADLRASGIAPVIPALFILCFTMAFGVVWELLEFAADQLLGVNMLKGRDSTLPGSIYSFERALINTMQDLVLDALGAFLVAAGAWFHLRSGTRFSRGFGYLMADFLKANPQYADKSNPET